MGRSPSWRGMAGPPVEVLDPGLQQVWWHEVRLGQAEDDTLRVARQSVHDGEEGERMRVLTYKRRGRRLEPASCFPRYDTSGSLLPCDDLR